VPRNVTLQVRVTAEEAAELKRRAGGSMSAFLREQLGLSAGGADGSTPIRKATARAEPEPARDPTPDLDSADKREYTPPSGPQFFCPNKPCPNASFSPAAICPVHGRRMR
jgi:hypothetical protein